MDDRARLAAAVGGTVALFLCIQLGALALVEPYVAAGAQPVEDPSDPGNVGLFFGVILVATAAMLAAIKFELSRLIRAFVLFACGWITWLVISTLTAPLAPVEPATSAGVALAWAVFVLPFVAGVGIVAALVVRPEWYVIDAAGVLLGAGAAGLFGYAFTPQLTIAFLVVLAVYDAVSVYGTEHMLTLAEGVTDLNVPVLLVVPTTAGYSLLQDDGPATLEDDDPPSDQDEPSDHESANSPEGDRGSVRTDDSSSTPDEPPTTPSSDDDSAAQEEARPFRDAIYVGLGDAVMPTILAASAAYFMRSQAPLYDVPVLAVNAPAVGAIVGTLVGLLALLWLVLQGRAHAGLPLLNGGAIAGFLVGATFAGVPLAEALGLPLGALGLPP